MLEEKVTELFIKSSGIEKLSKAYLFSNLFTYYCDFLGVVNEEFLHEKCKNSFRTHVFVQQNTKPNHYFCLTILALFIIE